MVHPLLSSSRARVHRATQRMRRALGPQTAAADDAPAPPPPVLPRQLGPDGSRRSLTLPAGWSEADLRSMLGSMSIDDAPASELAAYLGEDFERFVLTWELVADRTGRALEVGANPYFTTLLLLECTQLDLTLTNCFDPALTGSFEQTVEYVRPGADAPTRRTMRYESLNVEAQRFPWDDAMFDVVVFGEVIEHLTVDPVAALLEMHRVLVPGGTLVVTTPNVARLENVARLAAGANMYDPYSGYGAFGRHNREYTRHELVHLLQFCGFEVESHFTADVHPHRTGLFVAPERLRELVEPRLDDLGQYLFSRSTKRHEPRPGRPEELYRSMGPVPLTSWSDPPRPQ